MMGDYFGQDMMWGGGSSFFFVLTWLVFLVVGIFLAVYLWQKISKK